MVESEKFDRLGVFTYSAEEGTKAAEMAGQIPEEVKEERYNQIMRVQMEINNESNKDKIGFEMDVIIDEEEEKGIYVGRTRYDAPEINNPVLISNCYTSKIG